MNRFTDTKFVPSDNSLTLYRKRYLQDGEKVEDLWKLVAGGHNEFYDLMEAGLFLPNSPTLFNAGRNNGCTLSACFTADTTIHTLEGDFTVSELLTKHGREEFEVFSTDGKALKIGRAFGLRKTRTAAKVYKVSFDTGESIKLTADHLVMRRDGSYEEVRNLAVGDSIMPFNYSYWRANHHVRRYVCPNITGKKVLCYQWAFGQKAGRGVLAGHDVHHDNGNPLDDRTSNLVELSNADHAREHISRDNPMHRPEVAKKISKLMLGNKRGVGPKPGTAKAMKGNQHALKLEPSDNPKTQYAREWARRKAARIRREKEEGLFNHRVVSIEYAGREDVYDLSVHEFHNFAANGVFIHNCFVFEIDDEMGPLPTDNHRSIVNTRAKAIAVAKAGGGVGYYGGNLRPEGSIIRSVHRKACGPVGVLRDMHGVSHLITQGGKRELAQMWVQPSNHPDIFKVIRAKDDDPQGLGSFNISVSWLDEDFGKTDKAGTQSFAVFEEQVDRAWRHGCPGVFFEDIVNNKRGNPNPHLGRILAPNPCGETPNRSDEPCSLGSLVLWRFLDLKTRNIGWNLLESAIRAATRFMNYILDINVFPHPEITKAALLTRKLGLGVMGWADFLAMQGIHYDTMQAVELGRKVMGFIDAVATDESKIQAHLKGPYPGFSDKTMGDFRRNETNSSIAPTGSIAILADAFGSIEPFFALEWDRITAEGMKLKEYPHTSKWFDGHVPKVANEIAWEWHVRHQAAFQEFTDLGVSKTINLPNSATRKDVADAYRMMHSLGCKGGTVFRDGCRGEQVLRESKKKTSSVYQTGLPKDLPGGKDVGGGSVAERYVDHGNVVEVVGQESAKKIPVKSENKRKRLPKTRIAMIHKFRVSGVKVYLTVGLDEGGRPAEIFLKASKLGSQMSLLFDNWAIAMSMCLQAGLSIDDVSKPFLGSRFEPCGLTDNPTIPICTSVSDYVVRFLRSEYGLKNPNVVETAEVVLAPSDLAKPKAKSDRPDPKMMLDNHDSGVLCPECGMGVRYVGGCLTCDCGWSKCG